MGVGRFASHIARQCTAPLHHDAQTAEAKDLDLDRCLLDHLLHLRERQHARQHGADHTKLLAVEVDGIKVGGRPLHRQMQAQLWMVCAGVLHQPRVCQDDGVHSQIDSLVDCRLPQARIGCLRIRIEGHEDLGATGVGVGNAISDGGLVKVQAGKVACVGGVAQAQVDAVCAVVDSHFQGGQAAGWAHQLHARAG